MGLPMWSSIGYGNEENKPVCKTEQLAPRRSPIQRQNPHRAGRITNPEDGVARTFRRPVQRRRGVVAPTSASQEQTQEPSYHPSVRSPLVPSIGPISNVITRAQRVLGLAHLEMDSLLQRHYFPRPAVNVSRSSFSRRNIQEDLNSTLRAAREFSETTREQIQHLIRWERNLLRGEGAGAALPAEFQGELEALISECEVAMRSIRCRLQEFESWPSEARAGTSAINYQSRRAMRSSDLLSPNTQARVQSRRDTAHQRALEDIQRRTTQIRHQIHQRVSNQTQRLSVPASGSALPGGLGDRTRSASPENDGEAWDTMRMTLEPDDRLPSTDSSFTTAAASASFSAPSDRSSSSSAALSANTSRTSLTMSMNAEDDCGPENADEASIYSPMDGPLPEVVPSPLFRDLDNARSSGVDGLIGRYRPSDNLRLPPLPHHSSASDRGRSSPHFHPDLSLSQSQAIARSAPSYMFSAPRSQSPLSFVSNNGVSTGPSSAFGALDDVLARDGPLPTAQPTTDRSQPPTPGGNDAVMRLAFRYAAAVASSTDPHADPELEHLRRMFSTVASHDGQLNEDWWMSAGVASYLADEADINNDRRVSGREEDL